MAANAYFDAWQQAYRERNQFLQQKAALDAQAQQAELQRQLAREEMAQRASQFQQQFGLDQKRFEEARQQQFFQNQQDVMKGIATGAYTQVSPSDTMSQMDVIGQLQHGGALPQPQGVVQGGGVAAIPATPEDRAKRQFETEMQLDAIKRKDLMGRLDKLGLSKDITDRIGIAIELGPQLAGLSEETMNDVYRKIIQTGDVETLRRLRALSIAKDPAAWQNATANGTMANANLKMLDLQQRNQALQLWGQLGAGGNPVDLDPAAIDQQISAIEKETGKKIDPAARGAFMKQIIEERQKRANALGVLGMFLQSSGALNGKAPTPTPQAAPTQAPTSSVAAPGVEALPSFILSPNANNQYEMKFKSLQDKGTPKSTRMDKSIKESLNDTKQLLKDVIKDRSFGYSVPVKGAGAPSTATQQLINDLLQQRLREHFGYSVGR